MPPLSRFRDPTLLRCPKYWCISAFPPLSLTRASSPAAADFVIVRNTPCAGGVRARRGKPVSLDLGDLGDGGRRNTVRVFETL